MEEVSATIEFVARGITEMGEAEPGEGMIGGVGWVEGGNNQFWW